MISTIAQFIVSAGAILSGALAVAEDAEKIVTLVKGVLASGDPTPADWDALHAFEAPLTADLDAPMIGEPTPVAAS